MEKPHLEKFIYSTQAIDWKAYTYALLRYVQQKEKEEYEASQKEVE